MFNTQYGVVIVGAGPSGCAASITLSKKKVPHLIIDKAVFPRDKICGDALSGKVLDQFKKLDIDLHADAASAMQSFIGSSGVKFAAPNGKYIDIPFDPHQTLFTPSGYISKRIDFDHYFTKKIDSPYATFVQGAELLSAAYSGDGVLLKIRCEGKEHDVATSMVIASEGDRSVIGKTFGSIQKEPEHYSAGIRSYYTGVTGFHEQNFIELHFLKEVLPGYFWIFPLPNGMTNVGVGMLSASVSKKKVDLKKAMLKAIEENPTIRHRFKDAKPVDKIYGWGLPLGSKKRKLSGAHFLLTGDAGSLIDPFTGEGIGNAVTSGILAGETAATAIEKNCFDGSFLSRYDEAVYQKLWSELKLSYTLLKLCRYPWLFNLVINKAEKNTTLRNTISCMFADLEMRKKFRDPLFYFKLLTNT